MCYTAESNVNLSLTITKPEITILLHYVVRRPYILSRRKIYLYYITYITDYEPGGRSRWDLGRTHSAIRRNNDLPMLNYYYIYMRIPTVFTFHIIIIYEKQVPFYSRRLMSRRLAPGELVKGHSPELSLSK